MTDSKPFLSRPKNRTLEAYKAWMKEIIDRMLPADAPRIMTDKDWEEGWKKFWSKIDTEIIQTKPTKEPSEKIILTKITEETTDEELDSIIDDALDEIFGPEDDGDEGESK